MRSLNDVNPAAVTLYYFSVIGLCMFTMDPLITVCALLGGIANCLFGPGRKRRAPHALFASVFIITLLINPVISHNGVTVLFFVNDNPVTAEALVYGSAVGAMIVSVMYWFWSYSSVMTSDRVLYVTSRLSKKFSLVLSVSMRFFPLFLERLRSVKNAQIASGSYSDGNIAKRIRGDLRVFSVMTGWALENGIITAESMEARGFGSGRRTYYSDFSFSKRDFLFTMAALVLVISSAVFIRFADFSYYPELVFSFRDALPLPGYLSYFVLCFYPVIAEMKEDIRWKFLRSGI